MSLWKKNRGRRSWDCTLLQFQRFFSRRLTGYFLGATGHAKRARKTHTLGEKPSAYTTMDNSLGVWEESVPLCDEMRCEKSRCEARWCV